MCVKYLYLQFGIYSVYSGFSTLASGGGHYSVYHYTRVERFGGRL